MKMKQVIVMRTDLNMRKGKMCAQAAHASLGAVLDDGKLRTDSDTKAWIEGIFTKICVRADSEEELVDLHCQAIAANLNCALIKDAGLTEFGGVPTYTALAIGPGLDEDINKVTGKLKLL